MTPSNFDLQKARRNFTRMIICIALNYIFGTSFLSISYGILSFYGGRSNKYFSLLIALGNSIIYLSYGLNFFIYFSFNKLFRNIFFSLFKRNYKQVFLLK